MFSGEIYYTDPFMFYVEKVYSVDKIVGKT